MSHRPAKLAYLLCVCHKYSSKIFTELIKKHEKTATACAKYYFDLEIEMDFESRAQTESGTKPGSHQNFKIKNIHCNFLNMSCSNKHIHGLLEEMNTFSPGEQMDIRNNYIALISGQTRVETSKPKNNYDWHLYPLANLINMYADKYNYLFVPCTLDYSQDIGLVHQCAIIVDLRAGEFLFYEPYGTYIKYEHNYAHPMRQYFEIYANCLPARFKKDGRAENGINFRTFHERNLLGSEGIQQIILNANNASADDFERECGTLFSDEFKKEFADLYEQIKSRIDRDTNPVNQTDKTISLLTIMEKFEKYTPPEEKKEKFLSFWQIALRLYYNYNSKTCVSITLVELNQFFSGADLPQFYEKYRAAGVKPNIPLMEALGTLLTELDHDSAYASEYAQISKLCFDLS